MIAPDSPREPPLEVLVRPLSVASSPPVFRLRSGLCVVGSAPTSDLVISDPSVSRQHLEVELVPEGVSIRDLGSTNGTFYFGQRIERMTLSLGARITLGAVTLAIEPDAEAFPEQLGFDGTEYRGMIGASRAMSRLFAMLTRLEGSLVSTLVQGESGTGKELIARALHEGSSVSSGPFVAVNCGALPRELVASELFGHKKGAFTGASSAREGAFETADGGTLFLDEIGELPIEAQPMLLRVLESGEVRAVGGDHAKKVKVRVVAATNRDLAAEVAESRFREDLFFRLAVVQLHVPPLRERVEDIEPLARRFAAEIGTAALPAPVIEQLRSRHWSGNARELRNVVQAYAAIGVLPQEARPKGAFLDIALTELIDLKAPFLQQREQLADRFTRLYLKALDEETRGNKSAGARISGLDRTYLAKLFAKHGPSRS